MQHRLLLVLGVVAYAALIPGCGTSGSSIEIVVDIDEDADFSSFQTFTVLTPELVPEADPPSDDEDRFNDQVNALIIEAMTAPPVCMTFIPPEEVADGNEPDLFAGNGLARSTEQGTSWRCVGGWWWGVWGWFWDPCLWITPIEIEFDVGSLYLPVGPRPDEGDDPAPVFMGTARKVLETSTNVDEAVRNAVSAIFVQWPESRTCDPAPE
ncbi:MAG: DUF4136 domain-containing protein [Polyangiales bacterium]